MKKIIYFLLFIFLLAPTTIVIGANTNVDDNKIQLKGEICDEGETKTTDIDPIDIYTSGTNLEIYFYSKSDFKIEIYSPTNVLIYSNTVSRYGGKVLSVNMANWTSGNYTIVITNITYGKVATATVAL